MIKRVICFYLILIIFLFNCIKEPTEPKFEEHIIINAYLYVGNSIDSVYISKSIEIEETYGYNKAAISGANVFISVEDTIFQLFEYGDKPGVYYLPIESLIITPGKRYNLEVHVGDKVVRATTIAPDQVQINNITPDTTQHLGKQFQLYWEVTKWAQGYIISTIAKSTSELVDLGTIGERQLETFDHDTLKAFPRIMNFPANELDTVFQMPWFMFWYYGDFTIILYAVDQNLFDLSTSPVIYQHQSSEFEEPTYHIEGGKGIFAALSVDSVHVHVIKP